MDPLENGQNDILAGRRAVSEALRAGRPIETVLIAKGSRSGNIVPLISLCRERGVPVKETDSRRLDAMSSGARHQGVLAVAARKEYVDTDELFAIAEKRGEAPFFVICDEITDPRNLGAIARTAEAAGVHGLIIPQRRSAGLTPAVYKASAGALEYLAVARVVNLSETIKRLKERNVWVYGLDPNGTPLRRTDLTGSVALTVGSEGNGLGRLVRRQCDGILSLPMAGKVQSLNASVACAIALYEAARQRADASARK